MIGQDYTRYFGLIRYRNFKRVTLRPVCNRAAENQADLAVIGFRGKHQSRSAACLFPAHLWIERKPHHVTAIRHVHYHTSFPVGAPQSVSAWMFSGVTSARRSAKRTR